MTCGYIDEMSGEVMGNTLANPYTSPCQTTDEVATADMR